MSFSLIPTYSTLPYNSSTNKPFNISSIATAFEYTNVFEQKLDAMQIIGCICFVLIGLIGTVGNGLIMYYFGYKRYSCRSIPEMLFHYLAMVDFAASIFNPLLYIYWILTNYQWHFGYWACKLVVPIGTIATTTSGGILIIIAVDRQRTIVHPFKSHFKRIYIQLFVLGAICYALVANIHYSVNVQLILPESRCLVPNVMDQSYSIPTLICFVLQDLILIFIFAFTNYRIFSHIQQRETATLIVGKLSDRRKRETSRIIRLLVVMATVFFILTLPRDLFQVTFILSWIDGDGFAFNKPLLKVNSFLKILHTANSCVNVFIYFRMHRRFRKTIYKMIPCVETKNNLNNSTITHRSFIVSKCERDLSPSLPINNNGTEKNGKYYLNCSKDESSSTSFEESTINVSMKSVKFQRHHNYQQGDKKFGNLLKVVN